MEYTAVLGEAMRRFTEMLVQADLDADVPTCPRWQVSDLAIHLGRVHRWAAGTVLSAQAIDLVKVRPTEPLAEWYASQATALLASLAAVEDDEEVPNFTGRNETALFWKRRQAHETLVHCVDLAGATGTGFGVTAEIGADGIDELLSVGTRSLLARKRGVDLPGPVSIRLSDTSRTWTITAAGDELHIEGGAHSSATIDGTAADVYLGLWRRNDRSGLTVTGEAAERFLAGRITP